MKNNAENNIPEEGPEHRIINAPVVESDVNRFIKEMQQGTIWKNNSHSSISLFNSGSLRIALLGMHEKAILKPHSTNSNISVQVLQGTIKFITEERPIILKKGHMIALQSNIQHSIESLTDSFFILTIAVIPK